VSVEFAVRDFAHPLAILRLRASFERTQWWPTERLLHHQERLLRRTVGHAYAQVPYYRDLFRRLRLTPADIRTVADLAKLPTLPKATLRAEYPRLQAADRARFRPRAYQSSGTTGEPIRFLLDTPANVLEFAYYWRHWSWAGYRLGSAFAELASSFFLREPASSGEPFRHQRVTGRLLLNCLSLSPARVRAQAAALRKHRPRFLKGTASALYFFARCLEEEAISDIAFRAVFSTGEMLLPSQRKTIEAVLKGKVHDSYGHMERTVAVSECPHGGLHVNPEYGVLELVDAKALPGASERPVVARVLGTSLHNRSMPLLRYEVGDLIEADTRPAPCVCGRSLPLVRRIHGRAEDVVVTGQGVVTTLFTLFDRVPGVALGQVVQEEPDRLVIKVARGPEYRPESEALLLADARRFVGAGMRITLEYTSADAMRGGTGAKFRAVVSRVPGREA
jgi:phenylacetate-CoA ligase